MVFKCCKGLYGDEKGEGATSVLKKMKAFVEIWRSYRGRGEKRGRHLFKFVHYSNFQRVGSRCVCFGVTTLVLLSIIIHNLLIQYFR